MFKIEINHKIYTIESLTKNLDSLEYKAAIDLIKLWMDPMVSKIPFQTSGSTGEPKTLWFEKEVIKKIINRSNSFFNINEQSKIALTLSVEKTGGRMLLLRALVANCYIKIIEPKQCFPDDTFLSIDFVSLSPNQIYQQIENNDINQLKSVNQILIGGAPISETLENKICLLFKNKVYHSYGMTETLSHIAIRSITPTNEKYYTLLNKIEIELNDQQCLRIKDTLISNEWIETNDLVRITTENKIEFIGRYDDLINSGGIKINPILIENILSNIIHQPFIISSLPDDQLGEKLILIVEGNITNGLEIKEYIAKELSKYNQPKEIYQGSLCINVSGKVDRKKTKESITTLIG
jgi:O-succinylbenzoic acid--CoA ligase